MLTVHFLPHLQVCGTCNRLCPQCFSDVGKKQLSSNVIEVHVRANTIDLGYGAHLEVKNVLKDASEITLKVSFKTSFVLCHQVFQFTTKVGR